MESTNSATSASFDAYVIYLYIVMGLPVKEIAEHQGISKEEVSEILRHYGFNFKNTYGAGQHFKAYPKGKSFRLKSGKTIQLEITQGFVESYVKSGNFYDNSFEDFINRYFTPEEKPKRTPKPKPEKPDSEPVPPAPEKQPERKSRPTPKISPKLALVLKILAGVIAAALLVLMANCAGCIKFDEMSCEGLPPVFEGDGSEASYFDLYFNAMDGVEFTSEIAVLIDGAEIGTIDFSASDGTHLHLEGITGKHTVEIVANGEKSNLLSADTDANSTMYIVVSMESGGVHISQTSE
ncbi:MAG: hypothetical protein ACI4JS_06565 [Oscillospiraceae bacterium]